MNKIAVLKAMVQAQRESAQAKISKLEALAELRTKDGTLGDKTLYERTILELSGRLSALYDIDVLLSDMEG